MAVLAFTATAPAQIALDFTDPTPGDPSDDTLADTGFEDAYNLNQTGFDVTDGALVMTTLPGDMFGGYESTGAGDPDSSPQNVFYSSFGTDMPTLVEATVTATGLHQNFHQGGIWLGTDTDHYLRLGVVNIGENVLLEALRENEDLWGGAGDPPENPDTGGSGPGGDIIGVQSAAVGTSGQAEPITVTLRLIRDGNTATAWYALGADPNEGDFIQIGDAFDAIATGLNNNGLDPDNFDGTYGNSVEGGFKVGVFAFGGGDPQATISFDSFSAVAIPEPTSLGLLGLAGLGLVRRRR